MYKRSRGHKRRKRYMGRKEDFAIFFEKVSDLTLTFSLLVVYFKCGQKSSSCVWFVIFLNILYLSVFFFRHAVAG